MFIENACRPSAAVAPHAPEEKPLSATNIGKRRPVGLPKPLSPSTIAAYDKDLRLFRSAGGMIPCDVATIKKHIWAMKDKVQPATLSRRCMAIRYAHLALGKTSPTDAPELRPLLRALQLGYVPDKKILASGVMSGVAKATRRRPKSSSAVTRRLLGQMMEPLPRGLLDRRDRALILLCFAAALKRSEVVAINLGDLRFSSDALILSLGSDEIAGLTEETSVRAMPRRVAIPITGGELCAATAVRTWIEMAALDAGSKTDALFVRFDRGGDPTTSRLDSAYVSTIVKKLLAAIGIDATQFSAQSLISGRRSELARGKL
jgi:integrase